MGFRRYQAFGTAWKAETELRQRLFAHLQRLHFAFHDHAQTGQLMARSATDIQAVNQFLVMIPITISNIITMVAVTAILLLDRTGSWRSSRSIALPLINVFAKRFSSQVHPASMELQAELAEPRHRGRGVDHRHPRRTTRMPVIDSSTTVARLGQLGLQLHRARVHLARELLGEDVDQRERDQRGDRPAASSSAAGSW